MTSSWDQSVFNEALRERVKWADRTMRESVVTAAGCIAAATKQNIPFVAIGRIDSDLNVDVVPIMSTRGKRIGKPLKSGRGTVTAKTEGVPLGVLIVMARGNPGSKYSKLTGNRWPLQLPGGGPGYVKRLGKFVKNALQRMTMSRHSSPHFLQIGWNPAIRQARAHPDFKLKYRTGGTPPFDKGVKWNSANDKALGGIIFDLGKDDCVVTIENNIGDQSNEVLGKKHNDALWEHSVGPLQAAFDSEAMGMQRYMESHDQEGNRLFNAACA